jgi:hypothetical protein
MQTPHTRHLQHREYDRTRHSSKLLAWLTHQATRLGKTASQVFDMLRTQSAEQIASVPTPVAPANTALPVITGTATVGSTLTASNGTWSGTTPITYTRQWKKGGVNIAGATNTTYVVQAGDSGAAITVTVTATNAVGNASATSAARTIA